MLAQGLSSQGLAVFTYGMRTLTRTVDQLVEQLLSWHNTAQPACAVQLACMLQFIQPKATSLHATAVSCSTVASRGTRCYQTAGCGPSALFPHPVVSQLLVMMSCTDTATWKAGRLVLLNPALLLVTRHTRTSLFQAGSICQGGFSLRHAMLCFMSCRAP